MTEKNYNVTHPELEELKGYIPIFVQKEEYEEEMKKYNE